MTLFNAMSRFNVQNLGNMAWSFATANQSDERKVQNPESRSWGVRGGAAPSSRRT